MTTDISSTRTSHPARAAVSTVRICAFGDELLAGSGDPKALGWVGRVAARTPSDAISLSMFGLGVPGEGTSELLNRWITESERRFDGGDEHRVVPGLGHHDLSAAVSLPRSRLNLANILDENHARSQPVFVVGPPPTQDAAFNDDVGELSAAFSDVCRRRDVTYVDTFGPLSTHEQWFGDLGQGGVLPGQAGYGLMAWLVLHGGWHSWLGIPEAS